MKYFNAITAIVIISLLFSCTKNTKEENNTQNETPEVFQDKEIISDITSWKRGYYSIIEELYSEIKEQNEELQALEKNIEQITEDNYRDTKEIYKYISNNQNYYTEAKSYITSIQDSILKEKINVILVKSENDFNTYTENLNLLKETLKRKEQELTDLYSAMKIIITLHSMEKYQNNDFPDTSAVKKLIERYENLNESINTKINN